VNYYYSYRPACSWCSLLTWKRGFAAVLTLMVRTRQHSKTRQEAHVEKSVLPDCLPEERGFHRCRHNTENKTGDISDRWRAQSTRTDAAIREEQ
jgi:hypothetical protein